jgi:uncharacterized membrane protein YfcA
MPQGPLTVNAATDRKPDACAAEAPYVEPAARLRPWHVVTWLLLAGTVATLAVWDVNHGYLAGLSGAEPPVIGSSLVLLILALSCEFMDATIGMGYGTTLSPALLILGFPVKAVVPAALLSQLLANLSVAFFHHQAGNYNFWKDHRARNAGLIMGGVGLVISAATMAMAVHVRADLLRIGITIMVICIGVFMLLAWRLKVQFRMRNIGVLAGIAAFNKAFSGGGYGPLVAGGQVLVGMPVRAAVATTAIAEALVCLAAVVTYYIGGGTIPLYLLLPLVSGALLSTPLSAITLRRLPENLVKRLMGVAIIALGVWALIEGKGI